MFNWNVSKTNAIYPLTFPFAPSGQSCHFSSGISRPLLDGLTEYFVQTFMVPRVWHWWSSRIFFRATSRLSYVAEWNVLTCIIGCVSTGINCNSFGFTLTFHLVPTSSQNCNLSKSHTFMLASATRCAKCFCPKNTVEISITGSQVKMLRPKGLNSWHLFLINSGDWSIVAVVVADSFPLD